MPREGHRGIPQPKDPDPVGTALIEDLEQRIREAGVAGYVVVITPERAHWRYVLDAPWTALSFDRHTGYLRFRLKGRDFRTKAQATKTLELTLWVLVSFRDLLRAALGPLPGLIERSGVQYQHVVHDFEPPPKGDGA